METLKQAVDIFIVCILGGMGFIALWFSIERFMFLRRIKFENYQSQDELDNALTSNLTAIFIIYSNAPYVGLLGTVLGIMITFYDMGQAGAIDTKGIMTGLSLALYATALGLVVAIPTLVVYNALTRKVSVISSNFKRYLKNKAMGKVSVASEA